MIVLQINATLHNVALQELQHKDAKALPALGGCDGTIDVPTGASRHRREMLYVNLNLNS